MIRPPTWARTTCREASPRLVHKKNVHNSTTTVIIVVILYVHMYVFMQVTDIKEELGGLKESMEEMRGVCRQLQSQLKKFPDCSETAFEAEADSLMDNWLDVSIYAHIPTYR